MIPKEGIYFNIPFHEYLTWDAFSKSCLPHLAESPAQYQEWIQTRDDFVPTDPMIVGSAVDCLVFDGLEEFMATHFKLPAGVQRRATSWRFILELRKAGDKIPLPAKMWARVFAIADAVQSEPVVAAMLERSQAQVSWVWREPKTQVLTKGRLDLWEQPWIGDLKVTNDITPSGWRRQVLRMNQDWQAALYCEAMTALTGEVHDQWSWITARDQPVHGVQIYDLNQIDLVEAWTTVAEHIETYRVCKENNSWPANSGTRQTITLRRRTS